MNQRLFSVVERAEALSPAVSRHLVGALLRVASPFNGTLRAEVEVWDTDVCRVRVKNRRALHNHLGTVHAGALVTVGETPAGLLVIKNFPFSRYRLILKNLSVDYQRQAKTDVVGEARVTELALADARASLGRGEAALLALETVLREPDGAVLAVVRTTWQVKAWQHVRAAA